MSEQPENYGTVEDAIRETAQVNYFGFAESFDHVLPDGSSVISFKALNEGAKKKYQAEVQKPLKINTRTGDAEAQVDPTADRHALIRHSVTGWNLIGGNGQPLPYTERNLKDLLELADPAILDGLEKAIRKANKWLTADLTVKQIDEQIEELTERRDDAEAREAGEADSATK